MNFGVNVTAMALLWRWHKCRRELGVSPVELMVLLLLTERPKYGYEIAQELKQWFSGLWIPYVGTIYHCLRRLEKKEFVKSSLEYREGGLDRRNYTITEIGTEAVRRGIEYFRKQIGLIQHFIHLVNEYSGTHKDE